MIVHVPGLPLFRNPEPATVTEVPAAPEPGVRVILGLTDKASAAVEAVLAGFTFEVTVILYVSYVEPAPIVNDVEYKFPPER
jgi:hypothetical protein